MASDLKFNSETEASDSDTISVDENEFSQLNLKNYRLVREIRTDLNTARCFQEEISNETFYIRDSMLKLQFLACQQQTPDSPALTN